MSTKNKIDRLTIRGFQSIRDLNKFQLGNLNVLIGANGTGKSNFVNYFRMLGELVEQRLQVWVAKQGGADRILTFGIKETWQIESSIEFGSNSYAFILQPSIDDELVFTDELFNENLSISDRIGLHKAGTGHKESKLQDQKNYIARNIHQSISSWKIFHFQDTSNTAGVKRRGSVDDNNYLRPDASNLAAYLYKLHRENADTYNQIRQTVQLAIPFFDDFVLEPQHINGDDQQIRLLWRQKNSDYPMWPTQLSDGSIRFICLVAALLQPNPPSTIIIDEPELGLHPYALTLLGALIRSASTRMQVIVSTQSVPLLNEFDLEDLIVVERENEVSVFKRLDADEFQIWLEDYTVGELWEKNIIGGRP